MADINSQSKNSQIEAPTVQNVDPAPAQPISQPTAKPTARGPKPPLSCGPNNEMVGYAELLFFAYRDFTTDADVILLEYGFGRAHHRVLHFVSRNPGLRVADLLEILKITKQSLARVLKQLVAENIITQKAGAQDRRERRLYPTKQGTALVQRLSDLQCDRINKALEAAGPEAGDVVKKFLFAMIKRADRSKVDAYFINSNHITASPLDNNPDRSPKRDGDRDGAGVVDGNRDGDGDTPNAADGASNKDAAADDTSDDHV